MLLGTLLETLADESSTAATLEALGDAVLFARIKATGEHFGETPGQYAAGAARRFACSASNEDWLGLMSTIERSDDPATAALVFMVHWSLKADDAEPQDELDSAKRG